MQNMKSLNKYKYVFKIFIQKIPWDCNNKEVTINKLLIQKCKVRMKGRFYLIFHFFHKRYEGFLPKMVEIEFNKHLKLTTRMLNKFKKGYIQQKAKSFYCKYLLKTCFTTICVWSLFSESSIKSGYKYTPNFSFKNSTEFIQKNLKI